MDLGNLSVSVDAAAAHVSMPKGCTLPKEVIRRLPGLDELDLQILDSNFSVVPFVDSQLTLMSATELRELLRKKREDLQTQIGELPPATDTTSLCPVDVSKLNSIQDRAKILLQQASNLDEQLTASRTKVTQILKLRDILVEASSILTLCRKYVSQVSSLPTNLPRAISELPSTTQHLAYIRLIENHINAHSSIPAVETCKKLFSSFTCSLRECLNPVQESPMENPAAFWESALPHIALGTVIFNHDQLAAMVIEKGDVFLIGEHTINGEIQSLTQSIERFQRLTGVSTPYLLKIEHDISCWVAQARSDIRALAPSLATSECNGCNASIIMAIYESYITTVRKKLTRILKVVTIGGGDSAFHDAANAFVTFEYSIRQSPISKQLETLFSELKEPIQTGLFVPLFSFIILNDLDSNIARLKADSLVLLSGIDFLGFDIGKCLPPPQIFGILKGWQTFLQHTTVFLDDSTRLYVSEAIFQCMQELSDILLKKLQFPAETNPVLHEKYSHISEFPIQHTLLSKRASSKMTIYDPTELLVVPFVQTVISTIYAVLWSITTLESNMSSLLKSFLAIDGDNNATHTTYIPNTNCKNQFSEHTDFLLRAETLTKRFQDMWNSVLDIGMRTLAGIMAGEICATGLFPLFSAQPTAKHEFRRVQSLITGQFELFLETFETTPLPGLFAEILTPAICNAVGCCVVALPKKTDPLINVLSLIKELIHDLGYIVSNTIPSRLYDTVSKCIEEKFVGTLSFLLLLLNNPKGATQKQLTTFLPSCVDSRKWFDELVRTWYK